MAPWRHLAHHPQFPDEESHQNPLKKVSHGVVKWLTQNHARQVRGCAAGLHTWILFGILNLSPLRTVASWVLEPRLNVSFVSVASVPETALGAHVTLLGLGSCNPGADGLCIAENIHTGTHWNARGDFTSPSTPPSEIRMPDDSDVPVGLRTTHPASHRTQGWPSCFRIHCSLKVSSSAISYPGFQPWSPEVFKIHSGSLFPH